MAATPEHAARVLGLTVDATLEEVRSVRRELARKYHPDRGGDQDRASRHMARINAAVDTLTAYILEGRAIRARAREAMQAREALRREMARRAAARRAAQAASERNQAIDDSQPETDQACETRTVSNDVQLAATAPKAEGPSRDDVALIRIAAASYRKILDRIGTAQPGPTIDVTALAFPA